MELKSAEERRAENTNRNMGFFKMQMGLMILLLYNNKIIFL